MFKTVAFFFFFFLNKFFCTDEVGEETIQIKSRFIYYVQNIFYFFSPFVPSVLLSAINKIEGLSENVWFLLYFIVFIFTSARYPFFFFACTVFFFFFFFFFFVVFHSWCSESGLSPRARSYFEGSEAHHPITGNGFSTLPQSRRKKKKKKKNV